MAKMKVKMLCAMAGPEVTIRPGDECEVGAVTGARMCERGQAEPIIVKRAKAVVGEKRVKRTVKSGKTDNA